MQEAFKRADARGDYDYAIRLREKSENSR